MTADGDSAFGAGCDAAILGAGCAAGVAAGFAACSAPTPTTRTAVATTEYASLFMPSPRPGARTCTQRKYRAFVRDLGYYFVPKCHGMSPYGALRRRWSAKALAERLLAAKRNHGVDTGGAPRRKIARGQRG